MRQVEQDAARLWGSLEDAREHRALGAADIDDRPHSAEVVALRQGAKPVAGGLVHCFTPALRAVGILRDEVVVASPEGALKAGLASLDGVEQFAPGSIAGLAVAERPADLRVRRIRLK